MPKRTVKYTSLMAFAFMTASLGSSTQGATLQSVGGAPSPAELKARIQKNLSARKSLKDFYAKLGADHGGSAIAPLLSIASDEKNADEMRWAALFGLARLAGKESVGVIRKFMSNSSWMLRDAALKTAAAVNARELELDIAQRLKDDALIVRTTAVETIGHLRLTSTAPKLVDALFDPVNFHGGKALWIHRHILNVLAELKYQTAVPKLVELLNSSQDEKLQGDVVSALEKLTGKSFKDKPLKDQAFLWKRNTLSDVTF